MHVEAVRADAPHQRALVARHAALGATRVERVPATPSLSITMHFSPKLFSRRPGYGSQGRIQEFFSGGAHSNSTGGSKAKIKICDI